MSDTVDTLELKIQSDADSAVTSLEKLIATLEKLKQGLSGFNTKDLSKSLENIKKPIKLKLDAKDIESGIEQLRKNFKDAGTDFKFTGSWAELEKEIKSTENLLDRLFLKEDKFKTLGTDINTKGFQSLEYDISSLTNKLDILISKREELQKSFNKNLESIPIQRNDDSSSANIKPKTAKISPDSMNFNSEAMKAVFGKSAKDIKNWEDAVHEFGKNAGQSLNNIKSNLGDLKKVTKSDTKNIQKNFKNLGKTILNTSNQGKKGILGLSKNIKNLVPSANKATQAISKLKKKTSRDGLGIGRMLGTSLLFSSVFQMIGAIKNAVVEGGNNLTQYSGKYNAAISSIVSSLLRLKNAFSVAFSPIVTIVAPYLTSFINMLSSALNKVGQFFAALTGKKFVPQAAGVFTDYAAGLQESSKGMDSATGSAKKLKNALSVLPFDQLNQLTEKSDNTGGGDAGGGAGSINPSDMFVDSPVAEEVQSFANKIKGIFSTLFQPFKEAWEREGDGTITAAKTALTNLGNLAKSVGKSFVEVWTNGTGTEMLSLMLEIAQNLFGVIGNIARQFEEAWNHAEIGTSILQNVFDLGNIILETIRDITGATEEWAGKLNFTPLLESVNGLLEALKPITNKLGEGLAWLWENALLPLSGWVIQDAVPAFINMVSSALGLLNPVIETFEPLFSWLWEKVLGPLANWTGEVFILAMEKITGLLDTFGKWISEHQGTMQGITLGVAGLAGIFKAVDLASTVFEWLKVPKEHFFNFATNLKDAIAPEIGKGIDKIAGTGGLFSKLATGASSVVSKITPILGSVGSVLFSPKGLMIAGIAAGVAAIILNWDKIKDAAGKVKDWISKQWEEAKEITSRVWGNISDFMSKTWSNLKTWSSEKFKSIKENISTAWSNVKQKTSDIWSDVKNFTKTTWDNLKSSASEKFGNIKDSVSKAWSNVKGNTSSVWSNIKSNISSIWSGLNRDASTSFSNIDKTVSSSSSSSGKNMTREWQNIQKSMRSIIESIDSDFSKSIRNITRNFGSLPADISKSIGSLYKAGKEAAQSFANGFRSVHIATPHIYTRSYTRHKVGDTTFSTPNFGVDWYKTGGLFSKASVIGVGEAGKEAVLPLENKRTMSMIADSIVKNSSGMGIDEETLANAVARGVSMAMLNGQNPVNVTCYAELRTEDNEVLARAVTKGQRSIDSRMNPTLQFGY